MKVINKISIIVIIIISIFSLSTCKRNNINSSVKNIKISGGTISDLKNKIKLNIPKNALNKDTDISIKYINNSKSFNNNISPNFLGAVEFGPSGTKFNKEADTTLELIRTPLNKEVSVFCYDEKNDRWDYVTSATVSERKAYFKITHFSKYECLDISPDMLHKYIDIVKQAKSTNKTDSWITETYHNYLVNDKHILDYYKEFNGLFYEACGLKITGSYQINGVSGDDEALFKLYGEENKSGNTYGLSTIAGETVDYNTYKKIAGKPKEKQEIVSISIIVEYKPIKPDIILTAPKTNLSKDESVDVTVYTHYSNPDNYFYPEFILPEYNLKLTSSSVDFTINKKLITTDDTGKANFKVKANKNKAKSIITASFDVTGDFGTHAESSISFGSEKESYTIKGHIIETNKFTFKLNPTKYITTNKAGSFDFKIEYDFEGTINSTNDILEGCLKIMNVKATLSTTPLIYGGKDVTCTLSLFLNKAITTANSPVLNFSGKIDNNGLYITSYDNSDSSTIVSLDDTTTLVSRDTSRSSRTSFPSTIKIKTENPGIPLLNFKLEEGTQTNTINSIKDFFDMKFVILGITSGFEGFNVQKTSESESTTQTITITKLDDNN